MCSYSMHVSKLESDNRVECSDNCLILMNLLRDTLNANVTELRYFTFAFFS